MEGLFVKGNYRAVNIIEMLVIEIMEDIIKMPGIEICKCQKCLSDVVAMSLNKLPAKYVTTHEGIRLTKDMLRNSQYKVDVFKVVLDSIKKVSENPKHSILKEKKNEVIKINNNRNIDSKMIEKKRVELNDNKQKKYKHNEVEEIDENIDEFMNEIEKLLKTKK
jgi:competence protein ComFB